MIFFFVHNKTNRQHQDERHDLVQNSAVEVVTTVQVPK